MLIAVYGTLRRGDYNHERFLGDVEPLSTEMLGGYEMFHLSGQFPYITQGDGSVLIELYDLEPNLANRIWEMERAAGYEAAEEKTSLGKALLFRYSGARHVSSQEHSHPPKVLSGDWFEWLSKFKPERLGVKNESE